MKKNIYKNLFLLVLGLFVLIKCKDSPKNTKPVSQTDEMSYTEEELYRPKYHFTPKSNWMNDPNGMFYFNGNYHLYFQYYPESNVWGPMHWGHAISNDLMKWKEQPIALYPDEKGYIFSGSVVVDVNNTSGFKSGSEIPVVAIFTYHDPKKEKEGRIDYQSQGVAYSLDEGMTWTKYAKNPVIKNPGNKDFRDPKVTWDAIHNQWVLVLTGGDKAMFYSSKNLIDWEYISDFGKNIGAHGGIWECPDFFSMIVEGTDEIKWVLIQSLVSGAPNGGSGTQYFIGDFDGKTFGLDASFMEDLTHEKAFWIDFGRDNYAGVTWSNIPATDGRKLFLGWMSNWEYAEKVPTEKWRSSMTIPRALKLVKNEGSYRIISQPIKEIKNFISKSVKTNSIKINKKTILAAIPDVDFSSLDIEFTMRNLKQDVYTFVFYNTIGDSIKFGLNSKEHFYFLDREKSGNVSFSEKFAKKIAKAPFNKEFKNIDVRVLLDKTSIEIFFNGGETVMSEIFFPHQPIEGFLVEYKNFNGEIENLTINQLKFE